MTAINKELYDALVAAGSPEDKASAAAATVKLAEELATQADIALLRADLNALEARLYKVIGAQTIALVLAMVGLKLFG
jgi:hypothetical protein